MACARLAALRGRRAANIARQPPLTLWSLSIILEYQKYTQVSEEKFMPNSKLMAILVIALLSFSSSAYSGPFTLITPAEAEREHALDLVEKRVKRKPTKGAPVIKLVSPVINDGPVSAPVDIELAFEVSEKSEIDRDSIRVYYGALRLDVTDRILGEAEFTENGLLAKDADVPKGRHKLLVVVRDSMDRESRKVFKFKVK